MNILVCIDVFDKYQVSYYLCIFLYVILILTLFFSCLFIIILYALFFLYILRSFCNKNCLNWIFSVSKVMTVVTVLTANTVPTGITVLTVN